MIYLSLQLPVKKFYFYNSKPLFDSRSKDSAYLKLRHCLNPESPFGFPPVRGTPCSFVSENLHFLAPFQVHSLHKQEPFLVYLLLNRPNWFHSWLKYSLSQIQLLWRNQKSLNLFFPNSLSPSLNSNKHQGNLGQEITRFRNLSKPVHSFNLQDIFFLSAHIRICRSTLHPQFYSHFLWLMHIFYYQIN